MRATMPQAVPTTLGGARLPAGVSTRFAIRGGGSAAGCHFHGDKTSIASGHPPGPTWQMRWHWRPPLIRLISPSLSLSQSLSLLRCDALIPSVSPAVASVLAGTTPRPASARSDSPMGDRGTIEFARIDSTPASVLGGKSRVQHSGHGLGEAIHCDTRQNVTLFESCMPGPVSSVNRVLGADRPCSPRTPLLQRDATPKKVTQPPTPEVAAGVCIRVLKLFREWTSPCLVRKA